MDSLWQDLRYSLRTLYRTPTFTAAAVLSLGLGVGANTTVFTLINALFLHPLPVDQPAQLVAVNTLDRKNTTQFGNVMPLAKLYRRLSLEGQAQQDGTTAVLALVNTVDVGYFRTLGVALGRGRDIRPAESRDDSAVAIINDTMAAKYWPGQDPLGRRVQFEGETSPREIVGIVATTKYQTLGEAPQSCIFVPLAQNYMEAMVLYVRAAGDPAAMVGTMQREVRALGRDVPVNLATGVQALLSQSLWMVKFGVGLLAAFGVLALGLASVGIYGVMAYSVTQRTREMGVRIALGANPSAVRWLVLGHALRLVGIGLALGLGGALLLGRAMTSLLYGVSGADTLSLAAAAMTLLFVAAIASYLPARRASRIDPSISLREA